MLKEGDKVSFVSVEGTECLGIIISIVGLECLVKVITDSGGYELKAVEIDKLSAVP